MGWWITLGILVLLAVLPLGVSVLYDEDGAVVKIIAGPVKITLFPRPKKVKKPKKDKKQKEKKPEKDPSAEKAPKKKKKASAPAKPAGAPKPEKPAEPVQQARTVQQDATAPDQPAEPEETPQPEKKGGSLLDFLPLVKTVFSFLGDFKSKLRVDLLELKLILGADDPCDLAVNYGRAWAALGNLLPRLERFLVIRKRDIDVLCDFTASQTTIIARLDLTITLGRILAAVFKFAFRALVEFIKIMIKRKGGTEK